MLDHISFRFLLISTSQALQLQLAGLQEHQKNMCKGWANEPRSSGFLPWPTDFDCGSCGMFQCRLLMIGASDLGWLSLYECIWCHELESCNHPRRAINVRLQITRCNIVSSRSWYIGCTLFLPFKEISLMWYAPSSKRCIQFRPVVVAILSQVLIQMHENWLDVVFLILSLGQKYAKRNALCLAWWRLAIILYLSVYMYIYVYMHTFIFIYYALILTCSASSSSFLYKSSARPGLATGHCPPLCVCSIHIQCSNTAATWGRDRGESALGTIELRTHLISLSSLLRLGRWTVSRDSFCLIKHKDAKSQLNYLTPWWLYVIGRRTMM